ncbi:conserved hypothetical protein [Prochlorococcus marinus subsp. pastoris str. CCMP1986]|uniref:Uncharacterized protein n=1 Tax=Prochlorococcus marinus subsp. pastoris (strain CCMP1986 / NIES-2087 / MED4) TaxID=59919 RepID=Q7V3K9_PROMP|nr:hypothetical protein [Prochlorococcus marinus]KGF88184.1 hypothetical protein PROCH_0356 [Prochlorococcus marinus str. EQPAC1]CAE18525.1 conserved hypothetical protein [Prochlorococcus marinus subsp. pastoris str. CCMP1986]
MNSPESLNNKSKNLLDLIATNWESLDESQKLVLTKIWKVLTYKWQLQILFNLPFLIWWLMDILIIKVHEFDLKLLSYLNLPDWALSLIGFGQSSS